MKALAVAIVILIPLGLMLAEKRSKFIAIVGPVLLCYGIGLLLGNIGISWPIQFIKQNISVLAVPLAIPLLMFQSNPMKWKKLAPKALLSFAAGAFAVVLAIFMANMFLGKNINELSKISAMLVGVYTGGTPNLAAIGAALEVQAETIPALIIIDTVLCGVYLLFLLSIAERVLSLFLKPGVIEEAYFEEDENIKHDNKVLIGLWAVLLSIGCLAIGVGISMFFTGGMDEVVILLSLTVIAFLLSTNQKVNALRHSYKIGEYLILAFCVAIGLMSNFSVLANVSFDLLIFCAFVVYGSIAIHLIFAYFLKIDTHHVMITSTAALFGPAFVGIVASRLKNPAMVVSGMTTGVIGYVVANVLGITVFKLLEAF